MLDLQMVLLVQQVQGTLAVQVPEPETALLGSSDVQSDLQVLRVPRNVRHIAAEEGEPVGGHRIVEALLEPEVPQDTLGKGDPLGMIEQVALLQVFVGGSQLGSCPLDTGEDLQHRALQMQQGQLQGEA